MVTVNKGTRQTAKGEPVKPVVPVCPLSRKIGKGRKAEGRRFMVQGTRYKVNTLGKRMEGKRFKV